MVAVEGLGEHESSVDAPVLNRFGLQVGRQVASRARQRLARWPVPLELDSPLTGLRTEGCALLPRMFSPATLGEIADVARRVDAAEELPHFDVEAGRNQVHGTWRAHVPDDECAVLDRFWSHPTVLALLSAAERRAIGPDALRCSVERLVDDGERDGAVLVRGDVAHPTHAMWLYLDDVFEADGPLVYYPGSQRIRPRQLREVYVESVTSGAPERVATDEELAARKLEPKVLSGSRGSAVLANTFGYHGWLPGDPVGDRLVLRVEVARGTRADRAPRAG